MKLCIPAMGQKGIEETIGQHFGKVPYYTLYNTETKECSVIHNTSEHNGGTGLPPEIMSKESVDIMLCGSLGGKAATMFEKYDIDVFVGATGSVKDAVSAWEDNRLSKAEPGNCCSGHGHHHDNDKSNCHGNCH